jgi:hypothetical protein
VTVSPSTAIREPTGNDGVSSPVQEPTTVAKCSPSYRIMSVVFTASSSPSSSQTPAKSAGAGVPPATMVATRRSAACSATSAWSLVRMSFVLIGYRR